MTQITQKLAILLSNTYTLYLKTQNYHWHVTGPHFNTLHLLFESQYQQLAEEIDQLAERLLMKGHRAPATFKEFNQLRTLSEGNASFSANQMLGDLVNDHTLLLTDLQQAIHDAQEIQDEATVALLGELMAAHEKNRWMLNSSKEESAKKL